jgi:hypothetical protein
VFGANDQCKFTRIFVKVLTENSKKQPLETGTKIWNFSFMFLFESSINNKAREKDLSRYEGGGSGRIAILLRKRNENYYFQVGGNTRDRL